MRTLDIKLFRDLRRLWAQALAIALVIAGAVATFVMSVGSYRSLDETRRAYYERYRFADVFATVRRAPLGLVSQIAEIPGVAAVDARIAKLALLDIPGLPEPATGQFISLPEPGRSHLDQLYVRAGRLPEPTSVQEVAISESFANAHGFTLGARFSAILNGRKRELMTVGIVLSPEFVYAIGPGDIMPDDRRFGVVWMPEKALAGAFDLDGAFSWVNLKLLRNASEREVILRLDALLDRYGGQAAYGRKDQTSHAFLDHELDMLSNMSQTLPPIFLLVAAFLVNLTVDRLVALEREQVGLFKALGYGNLAIASHYLKFVMILVLIGIVIGGIAGTWLGSIVTNQFGEYFRFPFLIFSKSPDVYVTAAVLSLAAGSVGAARALRRVVVLAPAVAMQPPAPPQFRHLFPLGFRVNRLLSQPAIMMLRGIAHHPFRAGFTVLGMALATAILVVSLFTRETMEQLIDADLSRIIDEDLRPAVLPESGLAISAMLAQILGVRVGDDVEVDRLEGQRRTVTLPVVSLVEDYFGIRGMMNADALSRLMREAPAANSVHVAVDESQLTSLYRAIKGLPAVSALALQHASLANFRATLAILITTIAAIYTGLAAIIAFGVVYNSARISLSERARELASLRVLGFTRAEVLRILFLELPLLTLLAQLPGWLIGYGLAWIMRTNLGGELMRVRLVVENSTYVIASAVVLAAALLSALVVRRRVHRLDLVAVLKTWE